MEEKFKACGLHPLGALIPLVAGLSQIDVLCHRIGCIKGGGGF